MLEVLQPGLLTTVQDTGRKGLESYGVPPSGALDPFLAAVANRLVGNPPNAPFMEFALIGPSLRFHQSLNVAVCGFGVQYKMNGDIVAEFKAIPAQQGSEFRFAGMKGWFGYIAVGGGIEREEILGSVSTYVAGGISKLVQKNEMLKTGSSTTARFSLASKYRTFPAETVLHLVPSQHTSRFDKSELHRITEHPYKIHSQSNRMGIRLDGTPIGAPSIRRSAPVIPGTVQIPPSGLPIILGPEGPTTGGYAQIGVLTRTSWTTLAAARPGGTLRFEWMDLDTARRLWQYRETILNTDSAWQPS